MSEHVWEAVKRSDIPEVPGMRVRTALCERCRTMRFTPSMDYQSPAPGTVDGQSIYLSLDGLDAGPLRGEPMCAPPSDASRGAK